MFKSLWHGSLSHTLSLSHCLSAPALSCGSILNMIKVELELLSNTDMFFFFEKGLGNGVCYISKRYSKANSK